MVMTREDMDTFMPKQKYRLNVNQIGFPAKLKPSIFPTAPFALKILKKTRKCGQLLPADTCITPSESRRW
jgi:hypothetical protein